jgi:hypothetical protein
MHFGENQLFPGSFGISPALPTAHPRVLSHSQVRASTQFHLSFTLAMGRSPGFGSDPRDSDALFRLAFASAPQRKLLNLATQINSSAHSSIGTPSVRRSEPLTACKHRVSGSISLPSRGAFHLSLTVLVHYRSSAVFSLGVWSPQLPTRFLVSRGTQARKQRFHPFAYGTITLYDCPFQKHLARMEFSHSVIELGLYLLRLTTPGQLRFQAHLATLV